MMPDTHFDAAASPSCSGAHTAEEPHDHEEVERATYLGMYLRALDSAREWREAGNPHNALVALDHAARFRAALLARPVRAGG